MAQSVDTFLAHHGVLGMHWGQRKQQPRAVTRFEQEQQKQERANKTKRRFVTGVLSLAIAGAILRTPYAKLAGRKAQAVISRGANYTRQKLREKAVNVAASVAARKNLKVTK